jgi:hypothetical protein
MYSVPAIAGVSPHTMPAGERLRLLLFGRTAAYTLDSVNLLYTASEPTTGASRRAARSR